MAAPQPTPPAVASAAAEPTPMTPRPVIGDEKGYHYRWDISVGDTPSDLDWGEEVIKKDKKLSFEKDVRVQEFDKKVPSSEVINLDRKQETKEQAVLPETVHQEVLKRKKRKKKKKKKRRRPRKKYRFELGKPIKRDDDDEGSGGGGEEKKKKKKKKKKKSKSKSKSKGKKSKSKKKKSKGDKKKKKKGSKKKASKKKSKESKADKKAKKAKPQVAAPPPTATAAPLPQPVTTPEQTAPSQPPPQVPSATAKEEFPPLPPMGFPDGMIMITHERSSSSSSTSDEPPIVERVRMVATPETFNRLSSLEPTRLEPLLTVGGQGEQQPQPQLQPQQQLHTGFQPQTLEQFPAQQMQQQGVVLEPGTTEQIVQGGPGGAQIKIRTKTEIEMIPPEEEPPPPPRRGIEAITRQEIAEHIPPGGGEPLYTTSQDNIIRRYQEPGRSPSRTCRRGRHYIPGTRGLSLSPDARVIRTTTRKVDGPDGVPKMDTKVDISPPRQSPSRIYAGAAMAPMVPIYQPALSFPQMQLHQPPLPAHRSSSSLDVRYEADILQKLSEMVKDRTSKEKRRMLRRERKRRSREARREKRRRRRSTRRRHRSRGRKSAGSAPSVHRPVDTSTLTTTVQQRHSVVDCRHPFMEPIRSPFLELPSDPSPLRPAASVANALEQCCRMLENVADEFRMTPPPEPPYPPRQRSRRRHSRAGRSSESCMSTICTWLGFNEGDVGSPQYESHKRKKSKHRRSSSRTKARRSPKSKQSKRSRSRQKARKQRAPSTKKSSSSKRRSSSSRGRSSSKQGSSSRRRSSSRTRQGSSSRKSSSAKSSSERRSSSGQVRSSRQSKSTVVPRRRRSSRAKRKSASSTSSIKRISQEFEIITRITNKGVKQKPNENMIIVGRGSTETLATARQTITTTKAFHKCKTDQDYGDWRDGLNEWGHDQPHVDEKRDDYDEKIDDRGDDRVEDRKEAEEEDEYEDNDDYDDDENYSKRDSHPKRHRRRKRMGSRPSRDKLTRDFEAASRKLTRSYERSLPRFSRYTAGFDDYYDRPPVERVVSRAHLNLQPLLHTAPPDRAESPTPVVSRRSTQRQWAVGNNDDIEAHAASFTQGQPLGASGMDPGIMHQQSQSMTSPYPIQQASPSGVASLYTPAPPPVPLEPYASMQFHPEFTPSAHERLQHAIATENSFPQQEHRYFTQTIEAPVPQESQQTILTPLDTQSSSTNSSYSSQQMKDFPFEIPEYQPTVVDHMGSFADDQAPCSFSVQSVPSPHIYVTPQSSVHPEYLYPEQNFAGPASYQEHEISRVVQDHMYPQMQPHYLNSDPMIMNEFAPQFIQPQYEETPLLPGSPVMMMSPQLQGIVSSPNLPYMPLQQQQMIMTAHEVPITRPLPSQYTGWNSPESAFYERVQRPQDVYAGEATAKEISPLLHPLSTFTASAPVLRHSSKMYAEEEYYTDSSSENEREEGQSVTTATAATAPAPQSYLTSGHAAPMFGTTTAAPRIPTRQPPFLKQGALYARDPQEKSSRLNVGNTFRTYDRWMANQARYEAEGERRRTSYQTHVIVSFLLLIGTLIGVLAIISVYGKRQFMSIFGDYDSEYNGTMNGPWFKYFLRSFNLSGSFNDSKEESFGLCRTPECRAEGLFVSHSLNWSVNPCNDFYGFVCSDWNNRLAPASTDAKIIADIQDAILNYITQGSISEDDPEFAAKKLWGACMNTSALRALGLEPMRTALKMTGLDDWPFDSDGNKTLTDVWNTSAKVLSSFGVPSFLTVHLTKVSGTSDAVVVLDRAETFGSLKEFEKNTTVAQRASKVLKLMRIVNTKAPQGLADEVMEFVHYVLRLTASSTSKYGEEEVRSLGDLSLFHPFVVVVISGSLMNISGDPVVLLQSSDYITDLVEAVRITPPHVSLNFLGYTLMNHMSAFIPPEYNIDDKSDRRRMCLSTVEQAMPRLIHYIAYIKFKSTLENVAVRNIIDDLKHELMTSIAKATWLDVNTKSQALKRLTETQVHAFFPHWMSNSQVARDVFGNLPTINEGQALLSYQIMREHMFLSSLNDPSDRNDVWKGSVFDTHCSLDREFKKLYFPVSLINATGRTTQFFLLFQIPRIGVRLIRCLLHVLLDGNLNMDTHSTWWSSTSKQAYQVKENCFSAQYSLTGDIKDDVGEDMLRKVQLTEYITANAAIQPVLKLYKLYIMSRSRHRNDYRFQHAEGISTDQLFYFYYAMSMCKAGSHGSAQRRASGIVNGPLTNDPNFQKLYGCSRGTLMNPDEKCTFW